MRHRHDDRHGDMRHGGPRAGMPPHYAAEPEDALYDGLPSLTNREWGRDRSDDSETFGYQGQGGYGDFTTDRPGSQAPHGPRAQANATEATGTGGHRGRGPRDYRRPDERIVDDIIDRLTDDPHVDAREILVMVEDGEATLSGNVPTRAMKHRAEDLAAAASGVRDVHNRIRVDDGAQSAGPPGGAIRSGNDQLGSGFSSSARPDPVWDNMQQDSNWPGRHWPGQ